MHSWYRAGNATSRRVLGKWKPYALWNLWRTTGKSLNIHGIITFEETTRQWFGEGGHPDPRAQDRGDVCSGRLSGNPCPYNYRGGWIVPKKVADTIRRFVEIKNHLKLRVEGEERLGHCEVCQCELSFKIHYPLNVIMNHTSAEEYAKFPPNAEHPEFHCWLKTEAGEQPTL